MYSGIKVNKDRKSQFDMRESRTTTKKGKKGKKERRYNKRYTKEITTYKKYLDSSSESRRE